VSDQRASVGADVQARRVGALTLLGWTAFVMLVLYTVLLGGGWAGIYFVSLRILSLVLTAAGLVTWLVLAWRRPAWRPRSAIWPAFLAPLAAMTLATLLSERPRTGAEYVAWAVLLTALYLLLVRILATKTAQTRIGGLAAALGLGLGVTYVAVVLVAWLEWWSLIGGFAPPPLRPLFAGLTFGNPSAVLTAQVLLAVVAAAGLGAATRQRRLVLGVLIALTGAVTLLSGSRAGWLALAGAMALVGFAWLLVGEHRGRLERTLRAPRLRRTLWIGAVVAAVVGVILLPGILERTMGSGDGGRLSYFAAAWRMFFDSPVTGQGPGTWAPLRATYTQPGETDYYIPHAHDLYLHTLAEMGLLGVAAAFVVVACLAWLLWRAIRGGDPLRARWAWGATFALVYMAFHDLLDFYANMPAVLVLLAIPVAMLDATSDRSIPLPGAARLGSRGTAALARAGSVGLAVACLISLVGLARAESIAIEHTNAVAHIDQGEWELAQPLAASALAQDPELPPYQVTRALVAAHEGDWETAERLFARVAETDDLPQGWLGLALARVELGRPEDQVAAALERALRLGRQQVAVTQAAGAVYDRLGLIDEADEAYATALANAPSLAGDLGWTEDPGLASRFLGLITRAMVKSPASAWELALMAGHADRARTMAITSEQQLRIVDAWTGDAEALAQLQQAARDDPLNGPLLMWAARASAHAGDKDAAADFRRLARYVTVGADFPGYDVRLSPWPSNIDPAAGTLTASYGTYLYRRPTPSDLIPGRLPHFVYVDPSERLQRDDGE
jgi:O-antigen ligase